MDSRLHLRLRRQDLERSLASPHPESQEVAEMGLADWTVRLPQDEAADLLDLDQGTDVVDSRQRLDRGRFLMWSDLPANF